jgi:apolipoprotein N-acyltransferase
MKMNILQALRLKNGVTQFSKGLALATISGILVFTACPNYDIQPFAWIAIVPVLLAIDKASSVYRAVFFGWWTGIITNVGAFYWVIGLLERFGRLPRAAAVLLFLLLCAYQGTRFLLFGWIVRAIRNHTKLPLALVAPLAMVTSELCIPLIFQWNLAAMEAWQPQVIQIADLTGPLGVTALLMMINGAVYDVFTQGRERRMPVAITSLLVLVAVLVYGHLRIGQMSELRDAAPKIKVGVVQANVSSEQKIVRTRYAISKRLADLQRGSKELEEAGADLIVWPESSYPVPIDRQADGDWPLQHPYRIRQGFTVPLIMGAVTYDATQPGNYPYNSELMLDREGKFVGRFDKNFLLVFGEYIPGLETFPSLREFLPPAAGHFSRGKEIVTFPLRTADGRKWRLGPMICLEDILPVFGRKLAAHHPHLIVNITDDSWFGDTSEPWQHLSLSVFRSVELRTEMIRAVNPGVSAHVDATGRILAQKYPADAVEASREAKAILSEVALIEGGHTVYAAVGDLFGYLNVAAVIFLWFILPRWRRRKSAMA